MSGNALSTIVTVGKSSVGGAGLSIALTGLMNMIFGFWIGSHISPSEHLTAIEIIATVGAVIGAAFGCFVAFKRY